MDKDYIVIGINHADGRCIRIEIPKDGTVNTSIDQVQQWKVVDDANVGEVLETLMEIKEFYKKENIPFVFLPKKYIELELMTKEEAIKILNEIIDEVKKWE